MSNNPKRSAFNSIRGDPSPRSVVNSFGTSKRHKTSTSEGSSSNRRAPLSILKYDIKHVSRKKKDWVESSGVSVEILSHHTVYDLVDIVCKETCVGQGQAVDDKSWDLTDVTSGRTFSTGWFGSLNNKEIRYLPGGQTVGSAFRLKYDDNYYEFTLTSITLAGPAINKNAFPRRAALPLDVDFTAYNPGPGSANLNELFAELNRFLFEKDGDKLDICLFQPGRKHVHAFIVKGYDGIFHAIHVPERYDTVEEMLFALNESAKLDKPEYDYDEDIGWYPVYNTYGVSLFPNTSGNWLNYKTNYCTCHLRYYKTAEQEALCRGQFIKTFPKCAAAAGYGPNGSKRSKTSERGWIVYRNGTLTVCRGQSRNQGIKCAPHPGFCDGEMKHEPENDDAIVGRVNITINSLQELFCAAEALW